MNKSKDELIAEESIKRAIKEAGSLSTAVEESIQSVKLRKEFMVNRLMDVVNNAEVPQDEKDALWGQIQEYVNKIEKQEQNLDKIQEKFEEHVKKSESDWKEFLEDQGTITKEKVIKYLEDRLETCNNPAKINGYNNLIREIKYSTSLDNLKDISKIKNPSKIRMNYKDQFDKVYKEFYNTLSTLPNYHFPNPNMIIDALTKNGLSEDDAKLFFYYVISGVKMKKNLLKNTVFLDNLFKNIYRMDGNEDSIKFLENIKEVITILKEC